jgi:predicted ATPase/DNA-binding winged helix-turn-helix (wHTH) protein
LQTKSREPADVSPPQDKATAPREIRWHFGAFVLWETQRRLERSGQAVRLGPRSFDLLLHLLKRTGELVGKDELLAAVWAGVVVEDASVRVHMSLLRKALGAPSDGDDCKEWITTVPLRGYRFNGQIRRELADIPPEPQTRESNSLTPMPVRLTDLVGREADVDAVLAALASHRLVSIVGPGGIGKTSVAIRAAERWQSWPAAQIAFADLSPLISPDHVLGTIARSLGIAADLPDPVQAITQSLAGREALLLIDNCEHVVESLTLPITRLLAGLPGLRILATSRETLRVAGEYVFRLRALAVPDAESVTLAQALHWPSVELLVERARAAGAGAFDASDGPLLARISRQLDGIPLAIELVAARLGVQSVGDLALRLDDHMRLLSIGNRAALARHRTLAAALDWSIALLDADELRVFRRLSVFRGRFDVNSVLGITSGDMDGDRAFDALISLANKSLVFFDSGDAIAPYRLLDTTRSYAATLLAQSDERPLLLRRHATLMLELMNTASAELPVLSAKAWADRYAYRLDDVRFALEVCVTEQPDARLAGSLVTASAPLWFHLSQVVEYRDRAAAALKLVDRQREPDTETESWLLTSLIIALLHTDGVNPGLGAICDRAIAGALKAKEPVLELKARWGRCTHDMFRGEYAEALKHSRKLLALIQSGSDPAALNLAYRVSAMANHFSGSFEVARQHCETAIHIEGGTGRTRNNMVGVDPIVAAQAVLARTLWIQGDTANALQTATEAVLRAESASHAVSLCSALYGACPVALWSGEIELAGKWIRMMTDQAQRKGLVGWLRYAEWFCQGLQLHTSTDRDSHIREVSRLLASYDPPRREMLATFCPDWVDNDMIARIDAGEGLWSAAEVWRALGLRSEKGGMAADAETSYLRALDIARQQGARAWELRAALDLARLWTGMGRTPQAAQLLDDICALASSSGPDLMQARALRQALGGHA